MHNSEKNILIVSWYYYPELTPRAFRTHELIKEFCRQGYSVKLVLPNKEIFKRSPHVHDNLTVVFVGNIIPEQNNKNNIEVTTLKKKSWLKKILPAIIKRPVLKYREFISYYFYQFQKEYIKALYEELISETKIFEVLISIGLPIETHIATAKAIRKNIYLQKTSKTYADYGDPFSQQKGRKFFFWYYFIDLFVARTFDYIIIPTKTALSAYLLFTSRKRIKILPQGIKCNEYEIFNYSKNDLPSFAYAGVFYENLRNPSIFLDYISGLSYDFKFIIYTIDSSRDTNKILKEYIPQLNNRLVVKYNYDRKSIIKELSKMDFLINFENTSRNQVPSKLIDYAVSKRPICSISTLDFNPSVFQEFIIENYRNQISVNLEKFDIKKIVQKLL